MAISYETLLMALLALDSYHRQGKSDAENDIGKYKAALELGKTPIADIKLFDSYEFGDFYAEAYETSDGKIIISYRGTDNADPLDFDSDFWTGWPVGGGSVTSMQAEKAFEFYYTILKKHPAVNITVIGHSLGGGLAGLIGSITGQEAIIFDNMPFENAAKSIYEIALGNNNSENFYLEEDITYIKDIYYNGKDPIIAPNNNQIYGYATTGEILEYLRKFQLLHIQDLESHSGWGLNHTVDLHSQALLVALMYAESKGHTEWESFGSALIPQLFNNEVGKAAGAPGKDDQGFADFADKILRMLAYTVIEKGDKPFGDAGLAALFNDANELGRFSNSGSVHDLSEALAQIIVQYAGSLSVNKITQESQKNIIQGVVSVGENTLAVDLSKEKWTFDEKTTDVILGRQTLFDNMDVGSAMTGAALARPVRGYLDCGDDL